MNNSTLLKLVLIQIKDFVREPEIIFWAVVFPIGISGILGLAFASQEDTIRGIAIVKEQGNPHVVEEISKAVSSEKFAFFSCSEEEAILKLKRGEIDLYLKTQSEKKWSYHFDPKNSQGQLTYLMLEKEINQEKSIERPVEAVTSKGNRYIDFLIPGLLALGIMNSCIWGIGWNLIDSRIKKLLRRMVATPMKKSTFLTAHMITRFIVIFCEASLLFLFARLVFGLEIQGSLLALLLVYIAGTFAFAGIAILTSSRASNTQVGNGLINAVVLPMTIVSGVFFSYHNFPDWIEVFVKYLPLTLLAESIRAIFNEGAGLAQVFGACVILFLIGLVTFVSGLKIYKWY
jgi:ABC-2 type transport system permease protein